MLNRTPAGGQRTAPLRPGSDLWTQLPEEEGTGREARCRAQAVLTGAPPTSDWCSKAAAHSYCACGS